MTKDYKIANINIRLTSTQNEVFDMLKGYETSAENVDMLLEYLLVDNIQVSGNLTTDKSNIKVKTEGEFTTDYHMFCDRCLVALIFNNDYTNCKLIVDKNAVVGELDSSGLMYMYLGVLFSYKLTFTNGITLHGSAIKYKDDAIIFTAPSGVGKSTQANLWKKYFTNKVDFINDDKPALKLIKGKIICFGTPFAGKNHINSNICLPVKAIVNVVRAKENKVEKLDSKQSIALMFEETIRSSFNNQVNLNNINMISKIITTTPVYRLYCNISEQAVQVLHEALYEER